jgi:hypothetical protein
MRSKKVDQPSPVLVLLGRHAAALLEEHLGAAVAEVGEDDGDQLVSLLFRLVG